MCFLLSPLDGIAALQIETQAEEEKKEKPCRWPIANVFICFQSKHTFFFSLLLFLSSLLFLPTPGSHWVHYLFHLLLSLSLHGGRMHVTDRRPVSLGDED